MIDLDAYVANLRATCAEATVETNFHGVKNFVTWLLGRGLDLDTAPPTILIEFVAYLSEANYSPASITRYVTGLRHLHTFAAQQGVPVKRWLVPGFPRVRHKAHTILRGDQIAEFDTLARSYTEPWQTMLRLLPVTALRPGEMRPLERRDIEIPGPAEVWLLVRGEKNKGNEKSKSDRRVPLLRDAIGILRVYLVAARLQLPRSNLLFPSPKLSPGGKAQPTSAAHLERYVKTIGQAMNLDLSPYDLRHTAITMLAERNVDPKIIQAVAGHADFKITQRYIHLSPGYIHRGMAGVQAPWLRNDDEGDEEP